MMSSKTMRRAVQCQIVLAVMVSLPAQVRAQQVQYVFDQRMPGAYEDVMKLTSMGVIPFRGPDGGNFSAAIAGELQALRIGTNPVFNIRTEESGAAPGKSRALADANYVRSAGGRLGVKGIVWGTIVSATVGSQKYVGAAQSCSNNTCQTVPVDCVKYEGSYTVTPTIYSVETGKIVYTRQLKKDSVTDVCGGQVQKTSLGDIFSGWIGKKKEQQALTTDSILTAMRLDAAKAIVAEISPHSMKVKVGFKAKFPEFDKPTQATLSDAVAQLKSGRADKACGIFESLGNGVNTPQLNLLFNLGACYEVNGNTKVALQLYQTYDSKMTKVDPMINDALKRLGAIK